MKLSSFRVTNFRSINDSSPIEAGNRTVLVGRNESGKTSLLRVLASLNPPGKPAVFTHARDFPRDRKRSDFKDSLRVLETEWTFSDEEQSKFAELYPKGANAKTVTLSRDYAGQRAWSFAQLSIAALATPAHQYLREAEKALTNADKKSPGLLVATDTSREALKAAVVAQPDDATWGAAVLAQISALRAAYTGSGAGPNVTLEKALANLETTATVIAKDTELWTTAQKWLAGLIPRFVYLDEWEEVPGHYVMSQYLSRVASATETESDRMFGKLLKVADLDAAELQKLATAVHEERKLLTDRAGRVMTRTIRDLWTDRQITVDFSVDGDHFDVLVKDADTDALVPLDERSRGFRWYFSFFVTFAADTQGGDKAGAVLLLDEPGLFLHATAQGNLLRFFDTLPNPIVYSTHSPFMIDPERLESIRTVNLVEGTGTTVTSDPTGDANTLFPIQAALGYSLTQTLFVGTKNVVVEGVTDYWYISVASEHLAASGRRGLQTGIVITPAGGAQKAPYMVALLTSQKVRVVVLFDSEPKTQRTAKELMQDRLIRSDGVLFVGNSFDPVRAAADIEDLLDEDAYVALVKEAYKKELTGKTLQLNPKVPRVVVRVEAAFAELGLDFFKTRVASLWVRKMASAPDAVWSDGTASRFEKLFDLVNGAVTKIENANRAPFS
jgi:ABC-type cobalamin/Fe3+-siderophores transport system ATPase subunit